jgi:hypothetical protein
LRSKQIATLASVILVLTIVLFFRSRSHVRSPELTAQPSASNTAHSTRSTPEPTTQLPQASSVRLPIDDHQNAPDEYPQLSPGAHGLEAATDEYIENIHRDPQYPWKVPIRFYGKLIDQHDNPVPGAAVHFQWVNLQSSEGIEEADTITDAEGRFSLEGKRGKNLGVRIFKDGYYDVSPDENQLNFEYANPAERTFYEPDPNDPVMFRIRTKGEMEALIRNEVRFELRGPGVMATVDLLTGNVSPSNGQLQVTVWKPTITTQQINTGKVFPYDWRVQIRMNHGGLAEHTDAFPFTAPESGYVPQHDENLHAANGASPGTTIDKRFYFYFGQPPKYGRLHFRTDGDRPYVSIQYWLNPSGSRNLEHDPLADDDDP